jgi:hypothetical protein
MSRTNYNASDVITRTRDRVLYAYKIQNDFLKQKQLTLRGVQGGTPGAMPQPALIIPTLAEASQSITPAEFFDISLGLQADYDRIYGGGTGEGTGTGTGNGTGPQPLSMELTYISGSPIPPVNQVINAFTPGIVQVCGDGYFLSTEQIYGETDFIFTFNTPSSIIDPYGAGRMQIGVAKDGDVNQGDISVFFRSNGVESYFVINGNGVVIPNIQPSTVYSITYMASMGTATLRNETTNTTISTRSVATSYTTYAIYIKGSNWGSGFTPYSPLIVSNLTIMQV